jgi:competence protein ComEA
LVARVHTLRRDPRVAAIAIVLVGAAATVAWVRTSVPRDAPDASADASADGNLTVGTVATTTTAVIGSAVVHVVGAVRAPGVVELPVGARVEDAVAAAGGAADDADLQRLNLAAPVVDGSRIAVPRVGEPLPPAPDGGAGVSADASADTSGPLDLNTATADELDELPGIGPTLADAILRERERMGGFRSVEDLKRVRGIGDARFADLKDLVTV